jgi:hypothetical protein
MVPSSLGVIVRTSPTSSVTSGNLQSSESGVVHDHIRLRQHEMVAVACICVRLGARHVMHTGTTESGQLRAPRRAAVSSARVDARPR